MNPSVSAFTLAHLNQTLTNHLNQTLQKGVAARCAINRGKLMVLIEHHAEQSVNSASIFEKVENLVRQQLTDTGLPEEASDLVTATDEVNVQIYIKHVAASQPQDMHRFSWQLSDGFDAVFGEKSIADADAHTFEPAFPETLEDPSESDFAEDSYLGDLPEIDSMEETLAYEGTDATELMTGAEALQNRFGTEEVEGEADIHLDESALELEYDGLEVEDPDLSSTELEAEAQALWGDALDGEPGNEAAPNVAAVDESDVLNRTPSKKRFELPIEPRAFAAGLLASLVVGGLGYVLTRPCNFGRCDRITKAEALGDAARVALSDNPSPQTVLDMRDQLTTAVQQLRPIPPWSFHRDDAQTLLDTYQGEVNDLDSVINAQQEATVAADESQSPPHPIKHWQTVADQWRDAIALLESISPESTIHTEIVAPKLTEYRNNLNTIEGRIAAEQAADNSVNQALQSALLATQLAEKATSLEAWETALRQWENAVRQLKQIPNGTLAYGEAQKLLPKYDAELSKVRNRTRQERVANQFYNEAVRYAAEARNYESQNQWTLAMMNWRNALTQAKGIPQGTARHDESQNLIKTYQASLSKSQDNLRQATRFQKAESNINTVCGSALQYCTYAMQNGKVRLNIAAGYDDLIELSITPPDQRPAPAANQQMIFQANNMLERITNIGKQTQLQIELYDAGGAFIARYQPDLNGYVKR
ncbi:MAG: hypothetical protein AAGF01_23315 [Cyanobacteria bacterium P01_G01_bin.38]